jgi:hypothetical protein
LPEPVVTLPGEKPVVPVVLSVKGPAVNEEALTLRPPSPIIKPLPGAEDREVNVIVACVESVKLTLTFPYGPEKSLKHVAEQFAAVRL